MPTSLSRQAVLATALFATAFVTAVLASGCKKETKKDPPGDSAPPPVTPSGGGGGGGSGGGGGPPAGWSEGRDPVAGYRLYMPGTTQFIQTPVYDQEKSVQASVVTHSVKNIEADPRARAISFPPPAGFKPGTTPDDLFAALRVYNQIMDSHYEVLAKSPATLGGKPALKVVLKSKFLGSTRLPDDPEFAREELERRKKHDAKRTTYFVTTTGTRIIVLQVETADEPDPAFLKTLTESFAFL